MFPFNVRVYGVLLNEERQVLVSDEIIRGKPYTKFPGGGLEYGEGTRACLKREFMEEMNLEVRVGKHLYTTDFFQQSAWDTSHQVISIYYYVEAAVNGGMNSKRFAFDDLEPHRRDGHNSELFRFIAWKDFDEQALTLPIDKVVAKLLKDTS